MLESIRPFVFLLCFTIALLMATVTAIGVEAPYGVQYIEKEPFWVKRPSVHKRVVEDRLIAVSVTSESVKTETEWAFKGVGLVNVPVDFMWTYAQDFKRLAKIEDIFKRVTYDSEKQKLFVRLTIMGREKELTTHFQYEPQSDEKRLRWKNIEGLYKGMEGVIVFKKLGPRQTEIALFSGLRAEPSYLPSWLITFGVEALMHRVATSIRTGAEEAYAKEKGS